MSNKNKLIENFDESIHLSMSVISCRLYDLAALNQKEYHNYTEPIYTKLDSVYGYLVVSGYKVFFIWFIDNNSNGCDDVSERFKVEYVAMNAN